MDIYEECPVIENDDYKIRLIEEKDSDDLLEVYSDKNALPFFNSDNCHGSNFYCTKKEDMDHAIKYWLMEYHETRGFVRFSIVDKKKDKVIGTIEIFKRVAEDHYNGHGLLRLDLRSDYETSDVIYGILALVTDRFYEWFACSDITTKAALYAVERIEALKRMQYVRSDEPLVGHQFIYYDYWTRHQL